MKKIFLVLCMLVAVATASAQGNVDAIMGKIEKSEADLKNPKRANKASTWIRNANLYVDLANVNYDQIMLGIPAQQLVMMLGAPLNAKAIEVVEIKGVNYSKYQYSSMDVYVNESNVLEFAVETKIAMADALEKAEKAILEAYKIDPKSKDKVIEVLNKISIAHTVMADNNYKFGNYAAAAVGFYNAGRIASDELISAVDANELLYFAVASYALTSNPAEAKPALDMLVAREYWRNGDILYYQGIIEGILGNNEVAEAAYIRGVKEFPENKNILNRLISFYIDNNDDPNKVIPYIKKAQESDPTNGILYIAEGLAYDAMKDLDKSVIAYSKAVELMPTNFDAIYNLGLSYYRMSDKLSENLAKLDYNQPDYNNLQTDALSQIEKVLLQALDVFLKAHELDQNEKNTVDAIRSISFRLRNTSPEMMEQYKIFEAKAASAK